MAHLVRNGQIAIDSWQLLDAPDALESALHPEQATTLGALIALPLWLEQRERLKSTRGRLGVLLQGDDDPLAIVPDLGRLELVAVNIARFSDGRGYSIARLLRGRYRYQGELRALGDILHDQLFYLRRVGFDAFALRDDQDPHAAVTALSAFSAAYQAASDEPLPLFRRRQAFA